MTDKEKMLNGKLYFAGGDELTKDREKARFLTYEYNLLSPVDYEKKKIILLKLFGSMGENVFIEQPIRCDYGYNIHIGNNFFCNFNLTVLDCAEVTFGDNVFIAPNVGIFAAGHPIDAELRNSMLEYGFPIKIGSNVWIGGNAVINPGVTIGDNVVIGSGSVVTKDIPSGVVAAGNPCRIIRKINDDDKKYYFKRLTVDE